MSGYTGRVVLERAAKIHNLRVEQITGSIRRRPIVRAKWAVMLALDWRGWSSSQIGHLLGGMDHSSVLYGLKQSRDNPAIQDVATRLLEGIDHPQIVRDAKGRDWLEVRVS